jgi:RNA polymerase sigma-70 factor (ECF subfamily)
MSSNTDFELVKKYLDGDERAFNEIVRKYSEKIYWHARRMLGNHLDADEITQEVIIVLYKKLKTFNFNSSLYTWIYRITSNLCINYINKNKIRRFFSFGEPSTENITTTEDIVKNLEDREELRRVEEILQTLPPKQREVFILKRFEELSYPEISEITGQAVGTLKTNYFHALKKIMQRIKNDE